MNRLNCRIRVLVGLLLLGWGFSAFAREQWIRIRSSHFVVTTDDGPAAAVRVASNLENIRAAMAILMPQARLDSPAPLEVIAVRDSGTKRDLWPRHNGKLLADAGIFLPGHDEDFLFLDLGDS